MKKLFLLLFLMLILISCDEESTKDDEEVFLPASFQQHVTVDYINTPFEGSDCLDGNGIGPTPIRLIDMNQILMNDEEVWNNIKNGVIDAMYWTLTPLDFDSSNYEFPSIDVFDWSNGEKELMLLLGTSPQDKFKDSFLGFDIQTSDLNGEVVGGTFFKKTETTSEFSYDNNGKYGDCFSFGIVPDVESLSIQFGELDLTRKEFERLGFSYGKLTYINTLSFTATKIYKFEEYINNDLKVHRIKVTTTATLRNVFANSTYQGMYYLEKGFEL